MGGLLAGTRHVVSRDKFEILPDLAIREESENLPCDALAHILRRQLNGLISINFQGAEDAIIVPGMSISGRLLVPGTRLVAAPASQLAEERTL